MSRRSLAFGLALLLGCGSTSGGSTSATDTSTPGDAVDDLAVDDSTPVDTGLPADTGAPADTAKSDAPADADFGPYPPGPYGINKGETLAGLDWEGYVNDKSDAVSTTKPFVPTSLDQLRKKGLYGIIHVAEFS